MFTVGLGLCNDYKNITCLVKQTDRIINLDCVSNLMIALITNFMSFGVTDQ